MGDMGEVWTGHRAAVRKHRAEMLAKADTTGWTQHSPYHFSRVFNGVESLSPTRKSTASAPLKIVTQ